MTPEQRKAFMEHMHQTPGIIESILIDMDRVLDTLRMQHEAIESLRSRVAELEKPPGYNVDPDYWQGS